MKHFLPRLYSDMNEFIGDWSFENGEEGKVYRFQGKYKKFKNGNCKFYGKPEEIKITLNL